MGTPGWSPPRPRSRRGVQDAMERKGGADGGRAESRDDAVEPVGSREPAHRASQELHRRDVGQWVEPDVEGVRE